MASKASVFREFNCHWKYYVDQVHYVPQWSPLAPSYKLFLSTIIKLYCPHLRDVFYDESRYVHGIFVIGVSL